MTYMYVVSFVTYFLAELFKLVKLDDKYIPITNVFIGIVSSVICMVTNILPFDTPANIFESVSSCVIASLGAGGFYDILNQKYSEDAKSEPDMEQTIAVYGNPDNATTAPITHTIDENIIDTEEGVVG